LPVVVAVGLLRMQLDRLAAAVVVDTDRRFKASLRAAADQQKVFYQ
jgi:hypothetical protein